MREEDMPNQRSTNQRRVAVETLGCKLNQYETDSVATDFHQAGYETVPYDADADAATAGARQRLDRAVVRLDGGLGLVQPERLDALVGPGAIHDAVQHAQQLVSTHDLPPRPRDDR